MDAGLLAATPSAIFVSNFQLAEMTPGNPAIKEGPIDCRALLVN